MMRKMLKSKIHRATVTGADLDYEGSIAIDQDLMDAAGLVPFEAVHIWDITTGARLETYAIPDRRGSGTVCVNGAAARLVERDHLVIIASFAWMDEEEMSKHVAKVVLVSEQNEWLNSAALH
jgi:aspartate 1-decarboxylase